MLKAQDRGVFFPTQQSKKKQTGTTSRDYIFFLDGSSTLNLEGMASHARSGLTEQTKSFW